LPENKMNDYDALRDYLKQQKLPELVLSFEAIEEIIDAALPRAAQRASWWETLRSPEVKMPQREACLAAGYVAPRMPDGRSVKFKRMKKRAGAGALKRLLRSAKPDGQARSKDAIKKSGSGHREPACRIIGTRQIARCECRRSDE